MISKLDAAAYARFEPYSPTEGVVKLGRGNGEDTEAVVRT